MEFLREVSTIEKMNFNRIECPSCGSVVLTSEHSTGAFCPFCEFCINDTGQLQPDPNELNALSSANQSISKGDIKTAITAIEPLLKSSNPLILYGLGNTYKVLSDYTYYDVDYTQGGFMYSNGDKRNDEANRNKDNAMALLSKSKEAFYSAIYLSKPKADNGDLNSLYLEFMSEMKLSRPAHAAKALKQMIAQYKDQVMTNYASMVYTIETKNPRAAEYIGVFLQASQVNSLYYLARYMTEKERVSDAKRVLTVLQKKAWSPMANSLSRKIEEVEAATKL